MGMLVDIYRLLLQWFLTELGLIIPPSGNTGTSTKTPTTTGMFFWKLSAVGGNAVIASAKDINGTAVTALVGMTITDGTSLVFPLTEYTLTSGKVIEYQSLRKIGTGIAGI